MIKGSKQIINLEQGATSTPEVQPVAFKMSMMGELKYFLGFQVKQLQEGTFISQTKYIQDILTKFGMKDVKPI
jgi:hypothetical protein